MNGQERKLQGAVAKSLRWISPQFHAHEGVKVWNNDFETNQKGKSVNSLDQCSMWVDNFNDYDTFMIFFGVLVNDFTCASTSYYWANNGVINLGHFLDKTVGTIQCSMSSYSTAVQLL